MKPNFIKNKMSTILETYIDIKRVNILVESRVLFGDVKDVMISNLTKPRTKKSDPESRGPQFELKRYTYAFPGTYTHAMVSFWDEDENPHNEQRIHLIYHDSLDEEKLVQYLLKIDPQHFKIQPNSQNFWNKFDWCHYTNFGCHTEESDIYFLSVNALGGECSMVQLDDTVMRGDWHYGFKLTDPETKLGFAYGFGEILENRNFKRSCGCDNCDNDPLEIDIKRFSQD